MDIVMAPPEPVLYIALALPAIVLVAVLLKRVPWLHRIIALSIAVAASGTLLGVAYKKRSFAWDDDGIRDGTFQGTRQIAWSEMEEVRLVRGYWRSALRPTLRTNGTAYGIYRSGNFRLADGSTARVFLMTTTSDALLVRTADTTYLFAPDPFEPFLAAARAHRGPIAGD